MTRLEQIAEEFKALQPSDRLELLLEYSDKLPAIPERYRSMEEMEAHRVHECQTPVSLWVDVEAGKVLIYAHVPPEAPTVRGFMAMLMEAFHAASPQEVLAAPQDILIRSGLAEAIGMRRLVGLNAILRLLKQKVAASFQQSQSQPDSA